MMKHFHYFANFYLVFSLFVILNDCVGLSSAPFYSSHVTCKLADPTPECITLRTLAKVIYYSEMLAGFMLAVQSILLYYFNDNFSSSHTMSQVKKKVDIGRIKRIFKGLFIGYLFILALRIYLYN